MHAQPNVVYLSGLDLLAIAGVRDQHVLNAIAHREISMDVALCSHFSLSDLGPAWRLGGWIWVGFRGAVQRFAPFPDGIGGDNKVHNEIDLRANDGTKTGRRPVMAAGE